METKGIILDIERAFNLFYKENYFENKYQKISDTEYKFIVYNEVEEVCGDENCYVFETIIEFDLKNKTVNYSLYNDIVEIKYQSEKTYSEMFSLLLCSISEFKSKTFLLSYEDFEDSIKKKNMKTH